KAYTLSATLAAPNARALECAKINCRDNDFSARIIKSDCFESIDGEFDTITFNPPIHAGKKIVFNMYKGAFKHLKQGGKFYIVIQKKHGAESSIKMLNETFGNCETVYKKKGYYILVCTKG
ncbi:MAG: methyltransferase, partial [Clostridiales bacterium]|nr:methyltransferase [Clostridiales bacterium]